jgi:hypothetical protein
MVSFKRWLFGLCIALFTIGLVLANETSVPEAVAAEAAVAEAQAAVARAATQRALWTSAEEALQKARRALREKNFATAVEQARVASMHSELGIAQKNYPLFR